MENKGVIYILTNPSFPEYVKIGYADDVNKRLAQLNRSECTPFAFRVYATYEVDQRLDDLKLHKMIDNINPNLRSIDNVGGKQRVREFYAMSPETAYDIFETIAELGNRKERLKLWDVTEEEKQEIELAQEIEEEHIERLSPFAFSKCNIAVGSKITFVCNGNSYTGTGCIVVDDKNIEYNGKKYSLSALASEFTNSKHGVAGPKYFKYNGEWLYKIRAKLEGRYVSSRIDDVWVFPSNPNKYDIVAAFNKLDIIEWSQTTNTAVGDTIYIYVAGDYKSIMFKCEAIAVDLYGNRSDEDYEFYKEKEKKLDVKYMKIKLIEKYPVGQFPLSELKEKGLVSVQGRCKATAQLVEYLNR